MDARSQNWMVIAFRTKALLFRDGQQSYLDFYKTPSLENDFRAALFHDQGQKIQRGSHDQ